MDNNIVKNTVYDKLVIVKSTSKIVTKTQYDSDQQDLKKKFEDAGKKVT